MGSCAHCGNWAVINRFTSATLMASLSRYVLLAAMNEYLPLISFD